MNKNIEVSIENLQNGAIAERVNKAIEQVVKNALDMNTDYKAKRKVELKLIFSLTEDRQNMNCVIDVKTTLAPPKALKSIIGIGGDSKNVAAVEIGCQIPGQRFISENGEIHTIGNELLDIQKRAKKVK